MNSSALDQRIEAKMRAAAVAAPTISAFIGAVHQVLGGERGLIREADIEPVPALPRLTELPEAGAGDQALLGELVVFKLNGGLGTTMGLDRPKSLITVKGQDTFLDFIARQILHLRNLSRTAAPAFHLMDSFTTQAETLAYLKRYPDLAPPGDLDFLQSMVPKVDPTTCEPASWPADPELEWCPPGHGDFYPSLFGCGLLDRLLARGIKYAFVSNSDNLGATFDLTLLRYFAVEGLSFLMEVAERTAADRKGGHLTRRRRSGRLVLRESAQCPKEEEAAFQDIQRHRFFNTNNLWIRLDHLRQELVRNDGALPLPLITNRKNLDPRNADSPTILQLESAMGAAIECFDRSSAIVVPRRRFVPVKNTSDLLVMRSDACRVTDDHRLVLDESRHDQPPVVDLDAKHYRLMEQFEALFPAGVPSLVHCKSLKVTGPARFSPGVCCRGDVSFENASGEVRSISAGIYSDAETRV